MDQSSQEQLAAKLNYYMELKASRGISLNAQLATHPDFHSPDITERLLAYLDIDAWGSNRPAQTLLLGLSYHEAAALLDAHLGASAPIK
jgi:hypothetical protein